MPINRKYGWLRDRPDDRDVPYMAIRPVQTGPIDLPPQVDLREFCPPVFDQGSLGSCTANAICAAYQISLLKNTTYTPIDFPNLSRLFVYYNARAEAGTVESDSGAYIRDGIKTIANQGVCKEELWPYHISSFKTRPSDAAYQEALNHQAIQYASVGHNPFEVQLALADGYPVVFGFTVYNSFESPSVAKSGIMQLPKKGERAIGGHAVVAVGYNSEFQHLLVRNSWGDDWGQGGYFWMPFAYLQKLARDFWVIRKVE